MFFGDLTELRKAGGAAISDARIRAAREATRGGRKVSNLSEFLDFLEERFPSGLGFFDTSMSEGEFPKGIAAFIVSVTGKWSAVDQHGVYIVLGDFIVKRIKEAKASFESEAKYRDQLAGAMQHLANGLMHAAQEAHRAGMVTFQMPCFIERLTPKVAAENALNTQRQAASLRAQKYAQPGTSKSYYFSYKSALENLATVCDILAEIDAPNAPKNLKVARLLEKKAAELSLRDDALLAAVAAGEELPEEVQQALSRERRAGAVVQALLPARAQSEDTSAAGEERVACKPSTASEMCAACKESTPTHWGFACRCLCLCEGCAQEDLMECPRCGDFTEFVRRG